jgi:ankyrin repeat protein
LQYKNEESGQIPLHLALEANNNRMVNLILSNMAKIDFAAVNLIKDIFSQLINFQDFVKYLKQSPF